MQIDEIKAQLPALQSMLKEAGESGLHRRGNEQAGLLG